MNSDAVEPQQNATNLNFTNMRKECIIMLKRKLLSVLLALVLVVGMAVPALAASWGGTWGGHPYTLSVSHNTSSASATFTYNPGPEVTVYGTAIVTLLPNDEYAYGNRTSATGPATATTRMDNYGYSEIYQTWMQGAILRVAATGYVGVNYVVSGNG